MIQNRFARRGGFSLVELTIVVVILGVLATFAVPRFMISVERSKAAEAFNYLDGIQAGQAAYLERNGQYANAIANLDVPTANPQFFTVGAPQSSNWDKEWEVRLTRTGDSAGYGAYTVVFDQAGFSRSKSSIPDDLLPNL